MKNSVTISIVDDDCDLAEKIAAYLNKSNRYRFLSSYTSAEEALAYVQSHGDVEGKANLVIVNRFRRGGHDRVDRRSFGNGNVITQEELNTRIHTTKILPDHVFFGDHP